MIGNIIGGFIALLVGLTLTGTVSQEIDNVINCNSTGNFSYEQPIGTTDSFGGGGAGQFGGYDGQVHKSWTSDFAPIKTNGTLSGICLNGEDSPATIALSFVPLIFALCVLMIGIGVTYKTLTDIGMV